MLCRRGFTLVEVLVAMGLLVLVASLALPVALTKTDSSRAKTAERILKLAPNAARGEAQARGVPVALVLLPSADGTELRLAMVRQPEPASESAADLAADPDDISTWPMVDDSARLPQGTVLWDGPVGELEAYEAAAEGAAGRGGVPALDRAFVDDQDRFAPEGALGEPAAPVVLAWFLSDGSAMAGQATVVRLADGRVIRVRVEALAGRLEFTRAPELEEAGEDGAFVPDEDVEASREPMEADRTVRDGEEETRGFDDLEFESLEFDDLSARFDREPSDESREPAGQPSESDTSRGPERTNPQPPQPR